MCREVSKRESVIEYRDSCSTKIIRELSQFEPMHFITKALRKRRVASLRSQRVYQAYISICLGAYHSRSKLIQDGSRHRHFIKRHTWPYFLYPEYHLLTSSHLMFLIYSQVDRDRYAYEFCQVRLQWSPLVPIGTIFPIPCELIMKILVCTLCTIHHRDPVCCSRRLFPFQQCFKGTPTPTPSIEAFIESLESVSFQYSEYMNEWEVRIHSLKALNRFLGFID